MKIQHMAVIFVLIMIPITFVLSTYIGTQITTVSVQTQFDTRLYGATSDAIKSFQINTANNKYSSLADSKIRDLYASINTFYMSLGSNFQDDGYTVEDLKTYTPAIVYTLYDGYYIYGNYENKNLNGEGTYEYGLKPMMYYSCRYKNPQSASDDFVVNYTLDNYMSIMGTVNGGLVTKSGYFIDPELLNYTTQAKIENAYEDNYLTNNSDDDETSQWKQIRRENRILDSHIVGIDEIRLNNGVTITGEKLKETVRFSDVNDATGANTTGNLQDTYSYLIYNGTKYYKEKNPVSDNQKYFVYVSNQKQYVTPPDNRENRKSSNYWIWDYLNNCDDGESLISTSALDYYINAYLFSRWVTNHLSNVVVSNSNNNWAVETVLEDVTLEDGTIESRRGTKPIQFEKDFGTNGMKIFNTTHNNPEEDASDFQEHRRDIIRYNIENQLKQAIANFNLHASNDYQCVLPILKETEWDIITNSVSMITFMQGMPVNNYRYYNNYCVLANNKNTEFVGKKDIYLIIEEENGTIERHSVGCKKIMNERIRNVQGYNTTDFMRQVVSLSSEAKEYFYQHNEIASYGCIVGTDALYEREEILNGTIYQYAYGERTDTPDSISSTENFNKIRTAYMTALARERQSFYKVMGYFGS